MKVLLDEMFIGLKPFLKLLDWDVQTVEDFGLRGAEDEELVGFAERNGMVLVTQEQRIADMARLRGVRCVLVGPVEVAKIVEIKLRELYGSEHLLKERKSLFGSMRKVGVSDLRDHRERM